MKLELKHLAPYLPYNLSFVTPSGKILKTKTTESFDIRVYKNNSPNGNSQYHSISLGKIRRNHFTPLLRSLSDLTKEIEHNGEKFVPLDSFYQSSVQQIENLIFNHECSIAVFFKLIEWHFDVFGLIEKGLAVDIKTLK